MGVIKLLYILFTFCLFFSCARPLSPAQFLEKAKTRIIQCAPDTVHARGISVIKDQIFTANNNGFVYKYDDNTNQYEQLSQLQLPELRDIAVFSQDYFIALQSAEYSVLLHSSQLVERIISPFTRKTFLDGIDLNQNGVGIVMGDPLEDTLQVALTRDFGKTWIRSHADELKAFEGEAGFAASGTNVQVINDTTFAFVSGGKKSRFFKSVDFGGTWAITELDFESSESSGPFSVHFWDNKNGVIVGGSYLKTDDTLQNCFLTRDGGKTWFKPKKTTSGYKSSVIKSGNVLYACGTNGIDFSLDNGISWYKLSDENTFALGQSEGKIYATMPKGRVLEIIPGL